MKKWDLPAEWEWRELGDGTFAEIIMGQSPPSDTYNNNGDGLPFFQGKIEFGRIHPTAVKWCTVPTKIAVKGDVLISVRAPVGPTNLANEKCCIGRGLAAIRPTQKLDSKFLLYALRVRENEISTLGKGATFGGIGKGELLKIPIPIPCPNNPEHSLAEQKRIAAELDEIFDELKEIRDIHQEIKGDINKILKATIDDTFSEYSKNAQTKTVSQIARSVTDGVHQAPPKSDSGVPFIFISNIIKGHIDFANSKWVTQSFYDNLGVTRKPQKGDVLYSAVGSYGVPCLVETEEPFCFQRHIAIIKPDNNEILSKYLVWALSSSQVYNQATNTATGSAQLTVTLKALRELSFPLVKKEEQETIIKYLDDVQAEVDEMKAINASDKKFFDEFEQSVLTMAFRGEL